MIVKEIPVNIRCLEYRQDTADTDYGSCLYARFYFNLDKYELSIISDVGNYAHQWVATPEHESFLELMARITDDYLLDKLCGNAKEFNYEATKAHFYDYADDENNKKHLDDIFEKIECNYIPDSDEIFIELFDQEDDGRWCYLWEYLIYEYTVFQKKIAGVFRNHIQPVIRQMVKAESEGKNGLDV